MISSAHYVFLATIAAIVGVLFASCDNGSATSTGVSSATGGVGGGSGQSSAKSGNDGVGQAGDTTEGTSGESGAGGASGGAAGFGEIGGSTYVCDGTLCVSRLIGLLNPEIDVAYHLDIQIEGVGSIHVDCPAQGMDVASEFQFQCSAEKFYFYTPNSQSILASGTATLNAAISIIAGAVTVVDSPATAFTLYKGPYYDSADSPNPGCGGAPCDWHQATISH